MLANEKQPAAPEKQAKQTPPASHASFLWYLTFVFATTIYLRQHLAENGNVSPFHLFWLCTWASLFINALCFVVFLLVHSCEGVIALGSLSCLRLLLLSVCTPVALLFLLVAASGNSLAQCICGVVLLLPTVRSRVVPPFHVFPVCCSCLVACRTTRTIRAVW